MMPNDKYPVAQRETLIRIVRDRSVERCMSDRTTGGNRQRSFCTKLSTECPAAPLPPNARGHRFELEYRVRCGGAGGRTNDAAHQDAGTSALSQF
jgi:hypothetical protein